jgi:hypothetical protein
MAALEASGAECEVRLGTTPAECAAQAAACGAERVLVLWSFYSPDAGAMAGELAEVRALVPPDAASRVLHIAGGGRSRSGGGSPGRWN